jgi:hypothetical protein
MIFLPNQIWMQTKLFHRMIIRLKLILMQNLEKIEITQIKLNIKERKYILI